MTPENLREKILNLLDYETMFDNADDAKTNPEIADEIMSLLSQSESKETDSNEVKELQELCYKFSEQLECGAYEYKYFIEAILQAGYTKNKGEA